MAQLGEGDATLVQAELDGVIEAAKRGSALTKQRLAISRSHPLELQAIDFNARLRELVKLVRTAKCELLANPYDPDKLVRMVRAALEK